MKVKTVFFVSLLAVICFGLGLASAQYFFGSITDKMRHTLSRDMARAVSRELQAIESRLGTQSRDANRDLALHAATSSGHGSTVANEGDTLPYGPHGHDLLAALRQGGYTLVFRHAPQENIDKASLLAFDLLTLTKSRLEHPTFTKGLCLNAQGRAEAWLIGRALRELAIPVGQIWSSPVCRARELAEIAFGRVDRVVPALGYRAMFTSLAEADEAANQLRALLQAPPATGTNTVLTSPLAVIKFFPELQVSLNFSDAAVFRPTPDGQLVYASRLALSDWVKWLDRVDLTQPVNRPNGAVARR
jgi:hypothetical protein